MCVFTAKFFQFLLKHFKQNIGGKPTEEHEILGITGQGWWQAGCVILQSTSFEETPNMTLCYLIYC